MDLKYEETSHETADNIADSINVLKDQSFASDDNTEVDGPLCEQQEDFKVIPLLDITVNSDKTDGDRADDNAPTSASCSNQGVTVEETKFVILGDIDECLNKTDNIVASEPGNRPNSIQEDLPTSSNQIDRHAPSNTQTFNNPLFKSGERFDDQKHSLCEKSRHVIAILLLAVVLAVIIVTLGTLVVVLTHIASDLAECKWSPWSSWTDCNSSCGHGRRYRTRQHPGRNGYCSFNETIQSMTCKGPSCEDWSTWTPCSIDCGFGSQFRVLRVMIKRRRMDRFQRKTCSNFTCSGIVGSSGHIWAKSRTFTINTLKHFGFGKRLLQTRILEEVCVLLEILETKKDENIEIGNFLQGTFANIITAIVCNHRYELSDPKFSKLRENIHKQVQYSQLSGILDLVPFLEKLPGDIFKTKRLLDVEDQMSNFFKQHFDEHKQTFDDSNHRDFIDVYISEMKKEENKDVFTDHQLFRICRDLLLAGTDTTATSIKWCLLHMILKPEIQEKMYQEIIYVIGTDRFPSLDDRTKLPYSNAVCNETMRVANVAPLGVPRAPANKQDVEFKGFKVAGDATVYMNYDSIAFDTDIFPDPDEFIPERFLPNSSHYSAKLKYVVPFSMGKRACPGEVLARQEIFLTLVALVQKFKFLPARDRPMPENKRVLGNAFFPKDYELRVQTR